MWFGVVDFHDVPPETAATRNAVPDEDPQTTNKEVTPSQNPLQAKLKLTLKSTVAESPSHK